MTMTPNEAVEDLSDALSDAHERASAAFQNYAIDSEAPEVVVVSAEALATVLTALTATASAIASLNDYWDRGAAALAR